MKNLINFWSKHWKWIISTMIIIVSVVVTIIKSKTENQEMIVEDSQWSINTIGQIGDNSIQIGAEQRNITQDTKDQLSGVLPKDKNQAIDVNSIDGDPEAFRFASQIKEYIESLGYSVLGVSKRNYATDWTNTHIYTHPDGSVKEIIIGRNI